MSNKYINKKNIIIFWCLFHRFNYTFGIKTPFRKIRKRKRFRIYCPFGKFKTCR